ncbi:MAG TPA: NAD(P)H-binding protein [Xanthobacteraceae bacterium]|jgi:nucleoside-diphosphate-sugar epimerase|nr:NAD(P)H-binding protein [Xanthobacteraceae bacterium]
MTTLLCFGLGYSALHYVKLFGGSFERVIGTVRSREKAKTLAEKVAGRAVEVMVFDGKTGTPQLTNAIEQADAIVTSIAPDDHGDPVLHAFAETIKSRSLQSIVYLSTVGVYGNHNGGWLDEHAALRATSARGKARIEAEARWQQLGEQSTLPVAILRLGGIYGPRRNALVNLKEGTAKRIVKRDQVFNRIHVADIAQAIDAAIRRRTTGVFNVTDDEPTPPQDVIAFAAELLGIPAPPEIPFDEAIKTMSPMARSFYGDNRRISNAKLKAKLGVTLRYPTYREGISGIYRDGVW